MIAPQKDQKKRANENKETGFAKMANVVKNVDIKNIVSTNLMGMMNSSLSAAAA